MVATIKAMIFLSAISSFDYHPKGDASFYESLHIKLCVYQNSCNSSQTTVTLSIQFKKLLKLYTERPTVSLPPFYKLI